MRPGILGDGPPQGLGLREARLEIFFRNTPWPASLMGQV
jgi:hypothetical protein